MDVISRGVHPVDHGYRSMVDNEGVAASLEGAALPELLDLVGGVPN